MTKQRTRMISFLLAFMLVVGVLPVSAMATDTLAMESETKTGDISGQIIFSVEVFTIGHGYLIEPVAAEIKEGDTAATLLLRLLDEYGYGYSHWGTDKSGFYLECLKGDKIKEMLQAGHSIPPVLLENLDGIIDESGSSALGEFSYTSGSGWMYAVNNEFPGVGFADCYPQDGDVMRVQFTLAYGSDINADGGFMGDPFYTIANRDILTTYIAEIGAANVPQDILDIVYKLNATQAEVDAAAAALAERPPQPKPAAGPTWKEHLDSSLAYMLEAVPNPGFGTTYGEWTVLALARAEYPVPDGYYETYYETAINAVKSTLEGKAGSVNEGKIDNNKSTENERLILALSAIGKASDDFGGHDLFSALADMSYLRRQGINGSIYALIALDTGAYPVPEPIIDPNTGESRVSQANLLTRDRLIDEILSKKLASGGWALSGMVSDPDMTAMCIQSLAPYYNKRDDVKAAVDAALDALSALQRADGDFASWGTVNLESTAQVLVALIELGIDPMADRRFIKDGVTLIDGIMKYAVKGGGFTHTAGGSGNNAMATDQGTYALVAYRRFTENKTSLYNMTDVAGNGYAVKSAVRAKISEAEALTESDYTPASWSAMASALATATEAATKANATQAEVDSALKLLTAAIDSLVSKGGTKPVEPEIEDDAELAAIKEKALYELEKQFGKYSKGDYTSASWALLVTEYNAGVAAIKDASAGEAPYLDIYVTAALNAALNKMSAVTPLRAEKVTVAVSMDANTLGLGYIIKPTLVTVDKNQRASEVITSLLAQNGYSWKMTGSLDSSFYLSAVAPVEQSSVQIAQFILDAIGESNIWDSDRSDTTLEEFDYSNMSGWMYSVGDAHGAATFPGIGASDWRMSGGEVMRWQFTIYGYGSDLNADNSSWGSSSIVPKLGDKTNLIWAVAQLRQQYSDNILEANSGYNEVMAVLTNPQATQAQIDEAFSALPGLSFEKENNGGSQNPGGTSVKNGAVIAIAEGEIPLSGDPSVVVINVDSGDEPAATVEIATAGLSKIAENGSSIELRSALGNIRLAKEAVVALLAKADDKIGITLSALGQDTYSVMLTIDGIPPEALPGGITAMVPCDGGAGMVAVLLKEDGTQEVIAWSATFGGMMHIPLGGCAQFKIINSAKAFGDVSASAWYSDAVAFASARGLLAGTGEDMFSPGEGMTRAMLVTMLYRLEGSPAVTSAGSFSDVASDRWYTDAVCWASENSIVNGYTNGLFGTNDSITREQIATILSRYSNYKQFEAAASGSLAGYSDASSVSGWAYQAMLWANAEGIILGRTEDCLAPLGTATRAEAAAMLMRYIANRTE